MEALTAEAITAEAMTSIQARYQAGPVKKRAVTWGVRRDAFQAQLCGRFVSLRTPWSLLRRTAGGVPDAFSACADANGRTRRPLEIPLLLLGPII